MNGAISALTMAPAVTARQYGAMQPQPDKQNAASPEADPMPQPPQPPDLDECCGNGCDPCIFDRHDMAMDAYRQALRAWRARHEPGSPSQTASD